MRWNIWPSHKFFKLFNFFIDFLSFFKNFLFVELVGCVQLSFHIRKHAIQLLYHLSIRLVNIINILWQLIPFGNTVLLILLRSSLLILQRGLPGLSKLLIDALDVVEASLPRCRWRLLVRLLFLLSPSR